MVPGLRTTTAEDRAAVDHRAERLSAAIARLDEGDDAGAEALCRAILAAHPNHIVTLDLLAVALCRRGDFDGALPVLRSILAIDPADANALTTLAELFRAQGQVGTAAEILDWACKVHPRDVGLLARLGTCRLELGDPVAAARAYRAAVRSRPADAALQLRLAAALYELGSNAESVAACDAALAIDGSLAEGHLQRAKALVRIGASTAAVAAARRAAALRPEVEEVGLVLAVLLAQAGRLGEAAAICRQALAFHPDSIAVHVQLAETLAADQRLEEAEAAARRALSLDPAAASAHIALGLCHQGKHEHGAAAAAFRRAVELAPSSSRAHYALAHARFLDGEIDAARALFDRAVACDPNDGMARFNRAVALLLDGDLEAGFEDYEWRRKPGILAFEQEVFDRPEWAGEPLAGRTILLHVEQGLGDTLQFVRFVPVLEAMGARVVLRVQTPLVQLLARSFPNADVCAPDDPLPRFDCHLPLLSLPWRLRTSLATIPSAVPYLTPDAASVRAWRERLAGTRGLAVGVVWSGSPSHRNDARRSVSLERLLDAVEVDGVALFGLQKDPRPADAATLSRRRDRITDLSGSLGDYDDTAAVVMALDLVICVDTSVVHLAGALARPTWLMLPRTPCWRWLRDRIDSPWYPTARLFRQRRAGAWDDVFDEVRSALAEATRGRRSSV